MRTRLLPLLAAALSAISVGAFAQNRLPKAIAADESRVVIADSVNPHAREATDLGVTPDDTPIQSVSLRFNLTPAQNAALDALLGDQQNPSSARYHQWLSPEQYATQFGLSSADLSSVTRYLQSEGLTVAAVAVQIKAALASTRATAERRRAATSKFTACMEDQTSSLVA